MSDMNEMKLRRLDLTLLLVFVNLMRDRKAVTVAKRMGLTQSSISHALNRLRDTFGDPLFLRKPHGLEPTAYAIALEPKVRRAVELLDDALGDPAGFVPSQATGAIRMAGYDSELSVLAPALIKVMETEAPGLQLSARATGRGAALQELEQGDIDLAVGFFWDLPAGYVATTLYEESYAVVARRGHALMDQPLTAARFAACRHIIVSPSGDLSGIVDQSLEALGLARRVVCAVPLFFPALATVAESDLVATLPRRLAIRMAARFGLEAHDPPFDIRPFPVSAVRHRRNEKSGLHDWVTAKLEQLSRTKAEA